MNAREQQIAAARVLMDLLNEDLPLASWSLYAHDGGLSGQISPSQGSVQERLADMQKWADRLGQQIDVTRYEKRTGGSVNVAGAIDGVRIYIFAAFPKKDLPKAPKADG